MKCTTMAAQSASQGLEHELSDKPVVAIFSSRTCRHCKAAKSLLQDLGVVLQDVRADTSRNAPNLLHSITPQIDIGSRPEQRKTLSSYTQMTSVPQIFIGSRFIGGNDQLQVCAEGRIRPGHRCGMTAQTACPLQELHSNGKLADLLTPRSPDTPPRWLADLLADCSNRQASADLEPAAVAGRLAALEDAPSTAASSYVMAVLQRTKLGQVAPLKAGIFVSCLRLCLCLGRGAATPPPSIDCRVSQAPPLQQSDSTYKQPATIGPYMNSCTTLISLRDAFLEHGCSASAADGYTSFALHSGALVALNGLTKSASPCNKKWPLAVHSALRDFMVRGYLTPPPEAAADSAGVSSPEAGAGAASLEPGAGSFAVAQGMVQAAVARSHRSSLPNMMQSSLGLNATFESHVMPLVPNTEHDSAAAASPPSLDGPAGVPSSCSEEAGRAAAISAIFADCLDSVMEHIAPSGSGGYMYLGLQHSEVWKNYVRAAALLRRCCVPALSGDERKALFLNVYNGLVRAHVPAAKPAKHKY